MSIPRKKTREKEILENRRRREDTHTHTDTQKVAKDEVCLDYCWVRVVVVVAVVVLHRRKKFSIDYNRERKRILAILEDP